MKYRISHQLRKVRIELGFSQQYVAKKMKMTQSSYSKMENENDLVSLGQINFLASIFEKNPLELILLKGNPVIKIQGGDTIYDNSIISSELVKKPTEVLSIYINNNKLKAK